MNIGLDYLHNQRHITDEMINAFNICYCDHSLAIHSSKSINFSIKSNKFKDSIIIPVYSVYNDLLGIFSRRINPSENESKVSGSSWDKLNHLFGLNKSYKYILAQDNVFIVEGPFDMIACYQYGYKNSVALMGTKLSETQACLLTRFTKNATIMLDNDSAGIEGAKKSKQLLEQYGINVTLLTLEKDPDEMLYLDPLYIRKKING